MEILDKFVEKHKNKFGEADIVHLPMGSEETEERMRVLIDGPTDEHAGNIETSMMIAHDESMADVPPVDYPKRVIEKPFRTNNLKEFSEDGIACNHPEWIVSKEIGEKVTQWIVKDFTDELRKII